VIIIPAVLAARNFVSSTNRFIFTTLGKLIFNEILPSNFSFYVNDVNSFNRIDGFEEKTFSNEEIDKESADYLPLRG